MDEADTPDAPPDADEFVEYCRTQAALLSGRVQRMGQEADELLDEVDATLADLRGELEAASEGTTTPPSTEEPDRPEPGGEAAAAAAESAVSDVERKQSLIAAKRARMDAFNDLAGGYADLAEALQGVDDETALERIVQFEADNDAPAYFPDRETLAETVAGEGVIEGADAEDSE
ncbi:hypothetical protein DP107_14475 [Haloglomus irregulare]|jgi:hypothetical protein|uniref:Uncharacterized protein n=1 Tax=Haloglomus irregulare TaxID=2234134 RepID=A0A554MXI0_9EURY|nr:hypothetical protein [Haloglomus irregulare]TSD09847.1 hypothetical protein DP107_14475 [Haloglomus irregulare]